MKIKRNLFNYALHIYLTIYRIILIQRDEEGNLFIQADGNPIIPVDQDGFPTNDDAIVRPAGCGDAGTSILPSDVFSYYKSLEHDLGSLEVSSPLPMSYWHCGNPLFPYIRGYPFTAYQRSCEKVMFSVVSVCQSVCSRGKPYVSAADLF